jgi:hypothetical protein
MGEYKGLFSNLPESGVLLTITIIGCYIIGFFYVSAYYGRFGLSTSLINLPFTDYLTKSGLAIMLSFLICLVYIIFNEIPLNNRICCFFANIPILIFGIISILFAPLLSQRINSNLDRIGNYFLLFFGIVTIIYFIYLIYKCKFLFRFTLSSSKLSASENAFFNLLTKFFMLISLLIVLSFFSMYLGVTNGTKVIEGDPNYATSVQLYLTNDTGNISEKEMILVARSDDKYFIIEKEKPAPPYPKVYIIDNSQVRLAVLNTNLSQI